MASPDREFARGDRVRSSPDGPVMTVEEVYAAVFTYRYRCVWAGDDGHPQHELFRGRDLIPERPSD